MVWWCSFVGVVWQLCRFGVAVLLVLCGNLQVVAHGVQWGKNHDKTAHDVKKCAISYVMLLNFLAYMHFYGARACIFLKRPYLCIVFFIVLDLRLTRLGYSGIPFFLSLCQDAPVA